MPRNDGGQEYDEEDVKDEVSKNALSVVRMGWFLLPTYQRNDLLETGFCTKSLYTQLKDN